jgi:hypothetical protein
MTRALFPTPSTVVCSTPATALARRSLARIPLLPAATLLTAGRGVVNTCAFTEDSACDSDCAFAEEKCDTSTQYLREGRHECVFPVRLHQQHSPARL